MIGLLYKDMLYCKTMWKTMVMIALFMAVFGFFYNSMFAMTLFCIVIGGNFSILPFSYDKLSGWNGYQYAFPVSKKEVVCSRYLFALMLFGICALFQIVIMIVQNKLYPALGNTQMYWYWIITELLPVFVVALMQSVSYPFLYRFGAEKGRIFVVILVSIAAAIAGMIAEKSYFLHYLFIFDEERNYRAVFACILLVIALSYVISIAISIKIEQKKGE